VTLVPLFVLGLSLSTFQGDGAGQLTPPSKSLPEARPPGVTKPIPSSELVLVFAYGSEKKGWVDEVTGAYNQARHTVKVGGEERVVQVRALPMGSGEIIEGLLKPSGDSNRLEAHLVSPASSTFVAIGNGESREANGKDIIGEVQELVRSPLVLAMWSDLAEASGWRANPPSWREVFQVTSDPGRWKALTKNRPDVPSFRLGHTDPERSNSGLLTLILMVESAVSTPQAFEGGLTRQAVRSPEVADFLRKVESGVVRPLNSSTGFLADAMLQQGSSGMGAAIVYESLVIEKNRAGGGIPKLIAIYPKEGVFANEHPIGIVQGDWVTPAHTEAAKDYIAFLRARPQQEKAKAHGFRPADASIPIDELIKAEFGVANRNSPALTSPNSQVLKEIRAVWRATTSAAGAPAGGNP
jgi:Ca-activated chloride channel homolog